MIRNASIPIVGRLRWASMLLALALALAAVDTQAATYHVNNQSATCTATGPGTLAQPYCTIGGALAAHNAPGDTIVVAAGIYREQVTIPGTGGAAGVPLVVRAAGPGVVVDGADSFASTALWTLATGTVYRAASVATNVLQVFVDGARLTPSTAAPAQLPVNAFTWVTGQGLYVNLGGANPGSRQTLVGRRNFGFNVFTKAWITIEGFEITRQDSRGINLQTGCADIVIRSNRVSFSNSYGIQTVNGLRITIEGNVVSDCNLHGIGLTGGATACTVRNNESFRNIDPTQRRANGIHLFGAPGNTLSGNRLHDNQDSGLHFAGGSNNCVAFNNRSWNNGDHGYDHLGASGIIHSNDVAFGNVMDGYSYEGNSPNGQLFNCIGVDNGLTTNRFNLWVDLASSVGRVSDHNIFWNSTAQPPIKYIVTLYSSLTDYQLASGQDAHSKQLQPGFVNAAAGDFHLVPGSAAIDAGHSGAPHWPATDAEGTARFDDLLVIDSGQGPVTYSDIGALEFVRTTDLPPVVSAPNLIKVRPGAVVTFSVSASDPDGDPILGLTMVQAKMPANSGATFVLNAAGTGGTFTWATGSATGNFKVSFVATNALVGVASTHIQVKSNGRIGVEEPAQEGAVIELALSSGFPNPSLGAVEFALDLPRPSPVSWGVFDLQGRMVWSEARDFAAGHMRLRWDGSTTNGTRAPGGVYLMRASVDGATFTRRFVRF